jgi:diguanylate cyclase (GGDEF)-like protein
MVELPDPIVVIDGKGQVVDANRAAEHVLGLRPYGDVPVPLGTLWARSRQEPVTSSRIRLETVGEGGPVERSFEVTVTSLDRRGAPGRSALVLRDVTPLLEAHAKLKDLANTDELTGLANRRHFMESLQREIERARRYNSALSLVLLDLDHFKRVNDTHGHAAGDDVLRETASILREVCRDVDEAARIGGEELALLLPETNAAGARVMAERVRRRIEQTALASPAGAAYEVTASFGVASLDEEIDTPDRLLQASDAALYRAKEAGRNRVVVGR